MGVPQATVALDLNIPSTSTMPNQSAQGANTATQCGASVSRGQTPERGRSSRGNSPAPGRRGPNRGRSVISGQVRGGSHGRLFALRASDLGTH